jgi:hypothetical protein
MFDLGRIAAVRDQVGLECLDRLVVAPWYPMSSSMQKALGPHSSVGPYTKHVDIRIY